MWQWPRLHNCSKLLSAWEDGVTQTKLWSLSNLQGMQRNQLSKMQESEECSRSTCKDSKEDSWERCDESKTNNRKGCKEGENGYWRSRENGLAEVADEKKKIKTERPGPYRRKISKRRPISGKLPFIHGTGAEEDVLKALLRTMHMNFWCLFETKSTSQTPRSIVLDQAF